MECSRTRALHTRAPAVATVGLCATLLSVAAGMDAVAQPPAMSAAAAPATAGSPAGAAANTTLRVCADGDGLPQSNSRGEGYENKIAQALARDLGRKVEYTYFPQRMGFVRNTLRARDEVTQQFKCDVIIGVPKGYELTATTQPYMHSIYALVLPARDDLKDLKTADDLLKLPPEKLHALRVGMFAKTPASDWVLQNGLIDRAVMYATQSGDPKETADTIIERELSAGKIDVAIVWGPIAGFIVNRHAGAKGWTAVPFKPDPKIRFDYEISMGLRNGEKEWQQTLDNWIAGHRAEITQILTAYHIPLLEPSAPQS